MNRKKIFRLLAVLSMVSVLILALGGCSTQEEAGDEIDQVTLNLSVAASLTDAMQEIEQLYIAENPHITFEFNFGASGALQQQIEQGAPTDIFISAASKQMNELQEKDLLLDETRIDLVQNELVLVISKEDSRELEFADLAQDDIELIAIGDPESVPAGKYAQEAFKSLGIWEAVESKLMMGKDVRQVLAYIESGDVDVGLVYRTDAMISDKVEVAAAAPEGSHSPVIYPAAVIRDSSHPEEAARLVEYLTGAQAGAVLESYGFKILN